MREPGDMGGSPGPGFRRNVPAGFAFCPAHSQGFDAMTQMSMPILQIRNSNGGAWSVHAEFPDGSVEDVGGFRTENEANEWIAKDLQQWLEKRERKSDA